MEINHFYEISSEENTARLREVLQGACIEQCGMAEFAPGTVAHEGERHLHAYDEVFVILSGEITLPTQEGSSKIARAGDWIFVEAGLEHHLTNPTVLPCRALYMILKK